MLLDKNRPERFTQTYVDTFTWKDYLKIAEHTSILYKNLKSGRFEYKKAIYRINQYAVKKGKELRSQSNG